MKSCGITCTGKCSKAAIIQAFWGRTCKNSTEDAAPVPDMLSEVPLSRQCSAPFVRDTDNLSSELLCGRAQFESTALPEQFHWL